MAAKYRKHCHHWKGFAKLLRGNVGGQTKRPIVSDIHAQGEAEWRLAPAQVTGVVGPQVLWTNRDLSRAFWASQRQDWVQCLSGKKVTGDVCRVLLHGCPRQSGIGPSATVLLRVGRATPTLVAL